MTSQHKQVALRFRLLLLLWIASSPLGACLDLRDDGEGHGSASAAIQDGLDDTDTPSHNAVVLLDTGCTGTLITQDWVLSAAHCPRPRVVYFGARASTEVAVDRRYQHPLWRTPAEGPPAVDQTTSAYDLSLLHLARPVAPTDATPIPVLLHNPRANYEAWRGTPVTIRGWGLTRRTAGYGEPLLGAGDQLLDRTPSEFPVVRQVGENVIAWLAYDAWAAGREISATRTIGALTMPGDSGGPLLWGRDTDEPQLLGVASYVMTSVDSDPMRRATRSAYWANTTLPASAAWIYSVLRFGTPDSAEVTTAEAATSGAPLVWNPSAWRAPGPPPPEGDNCPGTYNPEQTDSDGDGVGDACESSRISTGEDWGVLHFQDGAFPVIRSYSTARPYGPAGEVAPDGTQPHTYQVRFPGLGFAGGHVQVSGPVCRVLWMAVTGEDLDIRVRCEPIFFTTPSFTVLVNFGGPSQQGGYLLFDRDRVIDHYAWNSAGQPNTVREISTGRYEAAFPGLGFVNAAVHVTAFGEGDARCVVDRWIGSTVTIACDERRSDGSGIRYIPAASSFSVMFSDGATRSGATGAHAWIRSTEAPLPYQFTRASSLRRIGSQTIRADSVASDVEVRIPRIASDVSRMFVFVTPYGSGNRDICFTSPPTTESADTLLISVHCESSAGDMRSSSNAFTLSVVAADNHSGSFRLPPAELLDPTPEWFPPPFPPPPPDDVLPFPPPPPKAK